MYPHPTVLYGQRVDVRAVIAVSGVVGPHAVLEPVATAQLVRVLKFRVSLRVGDIPDELRPARGVHARALLEVASRVERFCANVLGYHVRVVLDCHFVAGHLDV